MLLLSPKSILSPVFLVVFLMLLNLLDIKSLQTHNVQTRIIITHLNTLGIFIDSRLYVSKSRKMCVQ